jgi:hypothetical protein
LTIALEKALFDDRFIEQSKKNIRKVRKQYFWDVVLSPLVNFVDTASRSSDKGLVLVGGQQQGTLPTGPKPQSRLIRDAKLAFGHLKSGGLSKVVERINTRLNRK